MPLNPGDLTLSIIYLDSASLGCVVGKPFSFKLRLSNNSSTDPIYNINLSLSLPDGITFVNSSLIPNSNEISEDNSNVVNFFNVTDLYPSSNFYDINVTLQVDEFYRGSGLPTAYGSVISGMSFSVSGDSKPRGIYDDGNIVLNGTASGSVTVFRYSVKVIGPSSYIKGAGITPGAVSDATSIFNVSLEITNSTRDSSVVTLLAALANGLRYIGNWSSSGTDAANLANPVITNVSETQDHVSIALNNKTLSAGSVTTVSFQSAIWDNYTAGGVENSGAPIEERSILESSFLLSGNSTSYEAMYSLTAISLELIQECTSSFTDAGAFNDYILSYSTTGYSIINDLSLYFIIPDGMSYVAGSSTLEPNSITSSGNTTILTFILLNTIAGTEGEIRLSTTTDEAYADSSPVYSTDKFTTYFNGEYTSPTQGVLITETSEYDIIVKAPTITTEVDGYYYSDLVQKAFNVAAIEDYIKFSIIYDATNLSAAQKDVSLYDYPPLNIDSAGVINIEVAGDFPPDSTYYPMPDNGANIPIGDMAGGSYFKITFYLPVTESLRSSFVYNLAKCTVTNTEGLSYTVRDSSAVFMGIPNLKITEEITTLPEVSLNESFNYIVTITNKYDEAADYIVGAYNIDFASSIPAIYNIASPPEVTGTGEFGTVSVTNNNLSMAIPRLNPDEEVIITVPLNTSSLPISGMSYDFTAGITNGTAQTDPASHAYSYNDYPLTSELKTLGKLPSITKVYTPPSVKLFDQYDATITVEVPAGVQLYNTKIKDSLVTTDSSNLTNVTLNGQPATVSLSTNNITLPLENSLNTSSGPATYVFSYRDRVVTAVPTDYEQDRFTTASYEWSEEEGVPEIYDVSVTVPLKVVFPGIEIINWQSNVTKDYPYTQESMRGGAGDIIRYRLQLNNIGKSTAYNVRVTDVIPESLFYISSIPNGTFDLLTGLLEIQLDDPIDVGGTAEVIIECRINNDTSLLIAENYATSFYEPNDTPGVPVYNSQSNITSIYSQNSSSILTKYQRNVTGTDSFTTSTIRCFTDQTIEYKTKIYNHFDTAIENIIIYDVFPDQFSFISFNAFENGTLSVEANAVTAQIDRVEPEETIEYSYTAKLTTNTLSLESSMSTASFTFEGYSFINTDNSNMVYVKLTSLGKGYSLY